MISSKKTNQPKNLCLPFSHASSIIRSKRLNFYLWFHMYLDQSWKLQSLNFLSNWTCTHLSVCVCVCGGVHFFQEPKPIFEVSHVIISFLSPIISYSNSSYFRISLWNLVNIPIRPVIFQGCAVEFYSIVNTIFQVLNPLSYCPVPALSQFDEVNSIFILTLQRLQF